MQTFTVSLTVSDNTEDVKVGLRNNRLAVDWVSPGPVVIPPGGGTASFVVEQSTKHPQMNVMVIDSDMA